MIEGIKKIGDYEWELPIGFVEGMHVPGRFFLSEKLTGTLEEGALHQLANVATMPGIIRNSLAMPDIHWGYGFPIGGVAAFEYESGVISPGGVGFDINCGVRLLTTPLTPGDLIKKKEILDALYDAVPVGVGARSSLRFSEKQLETMMTEGTAFAVGEGFGNKDDILHCEEQGGMKGAEPAFVSKKARSRGVPQCGTLGAGNHFLEIQVAQEIYDEPAAKAYGLEKGQICMMVHCGSRGLGHQVCTDHLQILEQATRKYHINLPDKQLACAPLTSPEGKAYYGGMAAAANYAWANRQIITHQIRSVLTRLCGIAYDDIRLVYDVAHNVAKIEEHDVDGKRTKVCVHRKGATRAFGPDCQDVPPDYAHIGQPVIIPGSMGSSSYLLKGTDVAMDRTFGSTCHGAGRVLSRSQAKKKLQGKTIRETLGRSGIMIKAPHDGAIAEEAPDAYKSSSEVVSVVHNLGISRLVARLEPLGVIKG
ncbi:RtcB family protein [Methanospirillum stamsii]|uniref:tRNA-splicing ligase RtcB n=1 Tax=Methanospirillum stamsii TaxID=1277351 RepID=A0A2V2MZN4_9EURY|nr:RtcB family protein [Methanospirillum stamsii]PWR72939.1 RNA-splicing ligase RtcB [Methanospirillum stamsii]